MESKQNLSTTEYHKQNSINGIIKDTYFYWRLVTFLHRILNL